MMPRDASFSYSYMSDRRFFFWVYFGFFRNEDRFRNAAQIVTNPKVSPSVSSS